MPLLLLLLLADPNAADPRMDAARAVLESAVESGSVAGGVAMAWERDRVVMHDRFGRVVAMGTGDTVDGGTEVDGEPLFRIASMTKPITSVCLLTLVDEGLVSLDDPVAKFIPAFGRATVLAPGSAEAAAQPLSGPLTIQHLLTHTSGLTYTFWGEEPHSEVLHRLGIAEGLAESPVTLADSVRLLAGVPLVSQPGQRWHYSLSTDVLGRVIEVAAGQPFEDAMQSRVLDPLQMADTHFVLPAGKTDRLSELYRVVDGQLEVVPPVIQWEGNTAFSKTYPLPADADRPVDGDDAGRMERPDHVYRSGGAGLVSTAPDYLRFLRMLLNKGELDGVRVLKAATVGQMTANQIGEFACGFPIHGDKFGLGVGVHSPDSAERHGASPGTFGWGGFFFTYMWADPHRQVAGVLMMQAHPNGGGTEWADFQQAVYDGLNQSTDAAAAPGPQPGETYREVRLDNGGNLDWRVTDPRARARGAGDFLPNPVLSLSLPPLDGATRAEVTLDRWGGHLKTTKKAIRFGRQPWLVVPEIDTIPGDRAEYYYSQDNPTIEVPVAMLRQAASGTDDGTVTIEGLCETRDDYNWGQWGLYSLVLRVYYDRDAGKAGEFRITQPASGATIGENPAITVDAAGAEEVQVLGWYRGLDEDGDGVLTEWHGAHHQLQRGTEAKLSGHIGTLSGGTLSGESPSGESPSGKQSTLTWDTEWVPDQEPGAVRLIARVKSPGGLWTVTQPVTGLTLQRDRSVTLVTPDNVPEHFGVRTGDERFCTFDLDSTDGITEAKLALRTWHGWDEHHAPLRWNGHLFAIGGHDHHYDTDLIDLDPTWLLDGENEFRIRSDTHHHMLEVLWPGPLLLVERGK